MSTVANSSGWGRGQLVLQPATASLVPADGPGLQITDQQVGENVVEDGWPRQRDWALAVDFNLEPEAADVVMEIPRVRARITYGVGGADYTYECDVAATGQVLHVVAQWVTLNTHVFAPAVLPPRPVRVYVAATPGRPHTQTVRARIPYGTEAFPGAPIVAIAPRAAVSLVATTVEYAAGLPVTVTDGVGDWIYQSREPGLFSVVSPVVPLAQPVTVTPTFRSLAQGVSVPVGANAARLTDIGAGGWHYVAWEVQQ